MVSHRSNYSAGDAMRNGELSIAKTPPLRAA
jgi:hypothetical protein